MDEDRFKTYFRISVSSFEYVLGLVKDDILKQNTAFRIMIIDSQVIKYRH